MIHQDNNKNQVTLLHTLHILANKFAMKACSMILSFPVVAGQITKRAAKVSNKEVSSDFGLQHVNHPQSESTFMSFNKNFYVNNRFVT